MTALENGPVVARPEVLAARTESTLAAVADEVTALGRRAVAVPTDVSDADAQDNLVNLTMAEFGKIDILMNSAFVQPPQVPLLDVDLDDMRHWTDINVLASVGLVQKMAEHLVRARGAVVLINSVVLRNRALRFGAYRMHKFALLAAARSLSMELGPKGVRINSVAPGYIWSDKVQGFFRKRADQLGIAPEEVFEQVSQTVDLRRFPTPEEIADAAVFLSSDLASGVTGQCLDVTCGEVHH
ncbi:SDR family oxidoreductase [Nocardioides sp. JQ2195]|uniref:SDR family oxidoreductase n=1 Tax=Nocardioides sp. JQ2195 TaxID=2592334 RepID=UPI00143E44ED|nr:SDR family oxidoreductase [Nocardioides sp. JQ2195]QIX26507.1 SDR family oxidoreductase [Nocardioides sp. JQ2195]